MNWNEITFANPNLLWLALIIPILIVWFYFRRNLLNPSIDFSTTAGFQTRHHTIRTRLKFLPFYLRLSALLMLIIAIARPQSFVSNKNVEVRGIDIVLAQDLSSSMLAKDFSPNRKRAAIDVAVDFIKQRPNDRIGLVVFSGESFTQCPVTTDHSILTSLVLEMESIKLKDLTAIGDGLSTAINRLKDSNAKSKIVILLTDGENNAGNVDPGLAAEIAKTYGIRVYTIGVGTIGKAMMPVGIYPNGQYAYDKVEVRIDEKLLTQIAETTNGKYFRATNKTKLKEIYQEIDELEKTKFEVQEFQRAYEKFHFPAILALLLIAFEGLLRNTLLRIIPA